MDKLHWYYRCFHTTSWHIKRFYFDILHFIYLSMTIEKFNSMREIVDLNDTCLTLIIKFDLKNRFEKKIYPTHPCLIVYLNMWSRSKVLHQMKMAIKGRLQDNIIKLAKHLAIASMWIQILEAKTKTQTVVNKTLSFLFSGRFNFSQQAVFKSPAKDNCVSMNSSCLQKFAPLLWSQCSHEIIELNGST